MPASTQASPCREGQPTPAGEGGVGRGWQDIKHGVGAETKGVGERGIREGPSCTTLYLVSREGPSPSLCPSPLV